MSVAHSSLTIPSDTQLADPRKTPRRWKLAVLLGLVILVAAGCVASVSHLRSSADSAKHNEITQLLLSRSVAELSALEWEAAADKNLSREDKATAAGVIATMARLAHAAAGDPSTGASRRKLVAAANRYRGAVSTELAYYRAGEVAKAHQVDEAQTDPAADGLKDLVGKATVNAERVAAAESHSASRLTLLIAIVGGILTLLLLWRLDHGLLATRRAALLSEQAVRLREQASEDALTGLPNRRQLLIDLQRGFEENRPVALAFFDLDGFKAYNDTFGHSQGDLLLTRLGEKLAVAAGEGSAYRLGGDEFCVLLTDDMHLEGTLGGIRTALQEDGDSFVVSASYGVVHLPAEAENVTDALRLADTRMYEHKRSGRSSAANQTTDLARAVIAEHDLGLLTHAQGVADMAVAIGRQLHLDDMQLTDLRRAAELHDIGKVGVPRAILDRPGPLSEQEWEFIHQHPLIGQRILASAPALARIGCLVRSTHERYDGSGYPDRLAGEEIPLLSRIVFVCDSWDAMTQGERPYRVALNTEEARAELLHHADTQFDPAVVDAALRVIDASRSAGGANPTGPLVARPSPRGIRQGLSDLPRRNSELV
jgi:diguanylate cyclase (GGDEF)-like protein